MRDRDVKLRSRAALAAILISWAGAAGAQNADGRKLAQTFCNACHNVDPQAISPGPNPEAPPFAQIARTPGMTDLAIRVFLRSPHAAMPNFLLSDPEIDGVIAYIRTLGGP